MLMSKKLDKKMIQNDNIWSPTWAEIEGSTTKLQYVAVWAEGEEGSEVVLERGTAFLFHYSRAGAMMFHCLIFHNLQPPYLL